MVWKSAECASQKWSIAWPRKSLTSSQPIDGSLFVVSSSHIFKPLSHLRNSISSQKLVDEKTGPYRPHGTARRDPRSRDFNHFYSASSEFKNKEEGSVNSFKAHRFYLEQAKQKRKDLIDEANVRKGQLYQ